VLDVAFALVPRVVEHAVAILRRQMGRQQGDRGQVDRAGGEQIEQYRKSPSRPCGLDPSLGRMLGQAQYLDAVRE
jgi:hypothetical protein